MGVHINNLGQACDGRFCLDCGKCGSCSQRDGKTPWPKGRGHYPHRYFNPDLGAPVTRKLTRAKRQKPGATV